MSHDRKEKFRHQILDRDNVLLKLYRRHVFRHCLSQAVARKEQKWKGESFLDQQGNLMPEYLNFCVDRQFFIDAFYHDVGFHTEVNNQHFWHKTLVICYEDFRNNPQHVYDLVGVRRQQAINFPLKTPIRYREHVSNWNELYDLFPELIQDVQRRYFDTTLPRYYPIDGFYVEHILPDALKMAEFDCDD